MYKHIFIMLLAGVLGVLVGCARKPPDSTPEGALDAFLRAIEETPNDPGAPARAYALLDPAAREAIRTRAARANAITGKAVTAEGMLSPLWTPMRFSVERTSTTIDAGGLRAVVDVYGVDPTTQHVRVPLVREGDRWRVVMVVPDVKIADQPEE